MSLEEVQRLKLQSIAIPPLGCGNGGLNWDTVKPLITKAFADLLKIKVIIFEPNTALRKVRGKRQKTKAIRIRFLSKASLP